MTQPHVEDDAAVLDGREMVRLVPADCLRTPVWLAALGRRVSVREAEASGGRYTAGDRRWHLPAAALEQAPAPGSLIEDAAGGQWVVLAVEQATWGSRYVCHGRRLALAGRLEERVTIERAEWTKDAAGVPLAVWRVQRSGVPAAIQPLDRRRGTDAAAPPAATHVVWIAGAAVDEQCRVVHQGVAYRVLGVKQAERIDKLVALEVEQQPWP